MSNFLDGSVTRLHTATGKKRIFKHVAREPGSVVVQDGVVWVADWWFPHVVRFSAVGSGRPETVALPAKSRPAGVTSLAAGADHIWAADPEDRALVRFDPKSNEKRRYGFRYAPWGVAAASDGIWVVFRKYQ